MGGRTLPTNDEVKRLRMLQGLSQEELAFNAGVSRRKITDIEGGKGAKHGVLQLVAKALGVKHFRELVHPSIRYSLLRNETRIDPDKLDDEFFRLIWDAFLYASPAGQSISAPPDKQSLAILLLEAAAGVLGLPDDAIPFEDVREGSLIVTLRMQSRYFGSLLDGFASDAFDNMLVNLEMTASLEVITFTEQALDHPTYPHKHDGSWANEPETVLRGLVSWRTVLLSKARQLEDRIHVSFDADGAMRVRRTTPARTPVVNT